MIETSQIGIAVISLFGGLFFLAVTCVGILRLPDVYARIHAVGKSETLGSMLVLVGLAVYHGFEINSAKLIIIMLFVAFANPTATHVIARAAIRSGLQPWTLKKDGLDGDQLNDKKEGGDKNHD
jgi:multicomponent Na+:H+ antiporter subunit G